MKETHSNFLRLTEIHNRQKKERPHSVKETAGIAYSVIRKIPGPSRSQIVEELIALGFTQIEANEGLRRLEDNNELFIVEDSGLLKVLLYRNIISSEFERQQKQEQDAWLKAREEGE